MKQKYILVKNNQFVLQDGAGKCSALKYKKYNVFSCPEFKTIAKTLCNKNKNRLCFFDIQWNKFPDQTDNIMIDGYNPKNKIRNKDTIFFASFVNNNSILSQLHVIITLLHSFISSLIIVLPFYPVATMERVVKEGEVATASTMAHILSTLPSCGIPTRIMVYDLHTLQNRFYFSNNSVASLHSAIPLLLKELKRKEFSKINTVAFPDYGAAKRFEHMFPKKFHKIICEKQRKGNDRIIKIMEGNPKNKHIIIIDDLVQTGGTLYKCCLALMDEGSKSVSAFVTHSVFPKESWKKFAKGGDRQGFKYFITTNSNPSIVNNLPKNDIFRILDLSNTILNNIDEQ